MLILCSNTCVTYNKTFVSLPNNEFNFTHVVNIRSIHCDYNNAIVVSMEKKLIKDRVI